MLVHCTPVRPAERELLRVIRNRLRRLGIDVRRYDPERDNRSTQEGAVQRLAELEIQPKTVFDVGAAQGTPPLYHAWPNAHHVLIEPLEEFGSTLKRIAGDLLSCEVVLAAAGPVDETVTINVHPDLFGSSLRLEHEDTDVNGVPRQVPQIRLDSFTDQPPPYIIKIDTQGYELDVIEGASEILSKTEAVILEVSFFRFHEGGAIFHEVIDFMCERDFVPYDVFGHLYRPLDGALAQVDVAFVPSNSKLRQEHVFATRSQREWLTKRLRDSL